MRQTAPQPKARRAVDGSWGHGDAPLYHEPCPLKLAVVLVRQGGAMSAIHKDHNEQIWELAKAIIISSRSYGVHPAPGTPHVVNK